MPHDGQQAIEIFFFLSFDRCQQFAIVLPDEDRLIVASRTKSVLIQRCQTLVIKQQKMTVDPQSTCKLKKKS